MTKKNVRNVGLLGSKKMGAIMPENQKIDAKNAGVHL